MDVIYTVAPRHLPPVHTNDDNPNNTRLSISKQNILAFTHRDGAAFCVKVVDLEHPWEPWIVTKTDDVIDLVLWDPNGIELLVCTRKGSIRIYSMRESLLNCWSCLYSSSLNGERVLTAKWFHSGPKLVFGGSNSAATATSDAADRFSFSVAAFSPTLTGFGASARSGFVLVTATGLIKVFASNPMTGDHFEALEPISPRQRFRVTLASFACCQDGGMLLITSDGDPEMPISCYHLSIKLEMKNQIQKLLVLIKAMPSFFTTGHKSFVAAQKNVATTLSSSSSSSPSPSSTPPRISQLSFIDEDLNPHSPLTILVGITGAGYRGLETNAPPTNRSMPPNQINTPNVVTRLERWELAKQMQQVHPIFRALSAGKMMTQPQMAQQWRLNNFVVFAGSVRSIAPPRCSVFMTSTQDVPDSPPPSVALLFSDGNLRLLDWRQWKPIRATTLSPPEDSVEDASASDAAKKRKLSSTSSEFSKPFSTSNVAQTSLGCCLCVTDRFGRLYVLRSFPLKEISFSHVYWLSSFFAYCLATGRDFWEVVMLVRPGLVESVLENLSASTSTTKLGVSLGAASSSSSPKLMSLRECLYRSSGSSTGQAKAVDAYLKLYFSSLAASLKAMLRFRLDKNPSESLALVCASSTEIELSKVISDIHPNEFSLEGPNLLSMRQLLQWVGDFALFLVASLPMSQHSPVNHGAGGGGGGGGNPGSSSSFLGVSLVRDPMVLSALRELLLLLYLWGIMDSRALPTFTTSTSSKDAGLPLLFKLVTKAWIFVKEGSPFDDALLEECAMLQNQIVIPSAEHLLPLERNPLSPSLLPSSGSSNAPHHYVFERDPSSGAAVGGHSGVVGQPGSGGSSQSTSSLFVPSIANRSPHVSPILAALEAHTVDEQQRDLLHHTTLGVSPYELIRRCSRCGSKTTVPMQTSGKEKHLPIRAWEQRWLHRCFCGGMWTLRPSFVDDNDQERKICSVKEQ